MRIAGGEWCGRTLKVPPGDAVRPTQDRVRGALFSMIQAEIAGAAFLDLFAGAGSVGLEALSRGAARTTFVESNPRHAACLAANVSALGADRLRRSAVRARGRAWLYAASRGTRGVWCRSPGRTFRGRDGDAPGGRGAPSVGTLP